jgi:PAS domain S-box-containing protein
METVSTEHALTVLRKGLPFIRSGANGEIFDANEAFEELTGYSSYELKRRGWRSISIQDEDVEADNAITAELVTGKRQSMTVVKTYVSKLGVPIPGQLLAVRFPQGSATMECSLCFFIPLANGSKAALSLVVDYIEKHTNASHSLAEKIATMSNDLQLKKAQTVGERLWDTFGEWALQNPKTAIVILLILLSLNPFPIVVTYVTRMGWLPAQPVQIEVQDKQGSVRPATSRDLEKLGVIDGHEISDREATLVTLRSKAGNQFVFGDENGLRRTGSEFRQHDGGIRCGSCVHEHEAGRISTGRMGRVGCNGRGNVLMDDVARLLDRTKWYAFGRANDRSFQLSREAKGENF